VGHGDNSYNCAYGRKTSGLGPVHSDATPSTAVDATYRGPVRDGLAYTGARRRYTGETGCWQNAAASNPLGGANGIMWRLRRREDTWRGEESNGRK